MDIKSALEILNSIKSSNKQTGKCSYEYSKKKVNFKIACKYCGCKIKEDTILIDILSKWKGLKNQPTLYSVCETCRDDKSLRNARILNLAKQILQSNLTENELFELLHSFIEKEIAR